VTVGTEVAYSGDSTEGPALPFANPAVISNILEQTHVGMGVRSHLGIDGGHTVGQLDAALRQAILSRLLLQLELVHLIGATTDNKMLYTFMSRSVLEGLTKTSLVFVQTPKTLPSSLPHLPHEMVFIILL
jgi:hypothetical protein